MYKNASKHRHSFHKPKFKVSSNIADVAHAFQEWEQPKRKSTFMYFSDGSLNENYRLHFTDHGLESDYNPNKEPDMMKNL